MPEGTTSTPRIGVPIQFSLLGIHRHYPNEIFLRPVDILRLGRTKYSRPNLRCHHGESRSDFHSELKTETLQNPITVPRPDGYDQCAGMSLQAARKTLGGHYALFSALRLYFLFFRQRLVSYQRNNFKRSDFAGQSQIRLKSPKSIDSS